MNTRTRLLCAGNFARKDAEHGNWLRYRLEDRRTTRSAPMHTNQRLAARDAGTRERVWFRAREGLSRRNNRPSDVRDRRRLCAGCRQPGDQARVRASPRGGRVESAGPKGPVGFPRRHSSNCARDSVRRTWLRPAIRPPRGNGAPRVLAASRTLKLPRANRQPNLSPTACPRHSSTTSPPALTDWSARCARAGRAASPVGPR